MIVEKVRFGLFLFWSGGQVGLTIRYLVKMAHIGVKSDSDSAIA
ncbi:hypothetical protein J2Z26_000365 [Bacillus luteolus]|nr:hypothetical protein [Cytobacillus luteolus]